jgi:hypothetical protein
MSYVINPCKACAQKFGLAECNINDLNDCFVETTSAFQSVPNNSVIWSHQNATQGWTDCMWLKMAAMPEQANTPRNFTNLQINLAPVLVSTPHLFPMYLNQLGDKEKALTMCLAEAQKNSNNDAAEACVTDYNALESISPKNPMSLPGNAIWPDVSRSKQVPPGPVENLEIINSQTGGDSCINAKDGISGCRTCCRDSEDYKNCINKCMKYQTGVQENFYQPPPPPPPKPIPVYNVKQPPPPPPPPIYATYQDVASDKPSIFWTIFIVVSILLSIFVVIVLAVLVSKNIKRKGI